MYDGAHFNRNIGSNFLPNPREVSVFERIKKKKKYCVLRSKILKPSRLTELSGKRKRSFMQIILFEQLNVIIDYPFFRQWLKVSPPHMDAEAMKSRKATARPVPM